MNTRHEHEKAQVFELFKQQKIDRIEDRFKILEEFLNNDHHISTAELTQKLRGKGHNFSFEFVRDTMLLLEKFGFAESKHFVVNLENHKPPHPHGHAHSAAHTHDQTVHTKRWEHRHLGLHHDHMICTKCNKIIEFNSPELEALQEKAVKEHNFYPLQHKLSIYGLCQDCFNARADHMDLMEIKPGEKVRIVAITGPSSAKMRLTNMGFRVGHTLEVISSSSQNVALISQMQRFVVDSNLASYIKVESIFN